MHFRTIKIGGPCLAFLFTLSCTSTPAEQPRTTARTRAATTARPAAPAIPTDLAATDFDLHVTQIKKRLPSNDFTVLVQPPFVVIGDGPAAEVQRRADDTVKWTVDKLKQDYFTKDPKEIIDIWLFKDAQSYEKNT